MDESIEQYDVSVIGGGLAGLTLAIQCAEAGYSVILFERENYPFHKVCGEYVSMESQPFLHRLGVLTEEMDLPKINRLELSDIKGRAYTFRLPMGGFGISRYLLDFLIFQQACKLGVRVVSGTRVTSVEFREDAFTIVSDDIKVRSRIAAGAFGKRSNIDIKWGRSFVLNKPNKLNNYIGIKYHVRYPLPSSLIALHNFRGGYCGISRIEDDRCCLCYLTTANVLKHHGGSVQKVEEEVLCKNPHLRKIFGEAVFLFEAPLVISQISFARKKQVENHMLMIGDAAGLITPLCGNGMSMAMHASKLAFENIRRYMNGKLTREQMERSYIRQWRNEFATRLSVGRNVQRLFGEDMLTSFFLRLMKALPPVAGSLIRATHGKPY